MTTPTDRELEVLERYGRPGATYESVAEDLGITRATVSAHLRALYAKLGVSNAVQAERKLRRRRHHA